MEKDRKQDHCRPTNCLDGIILVWLIADGEELGFKLCIILQLKMRIMQHIHALVSVLSGRLLPFIQPVAVDSWSYAGFRCSPVTSLPAWRTLSELRHRLGNSEDYTGIDATVCHPATASGAKA